MEEASHEVQPSQSMWVPATVPDQAADTRNGVQCWGKGYHQRICKFYNLLLWNDTFYYVTSGAPLQGDLASCLLLSRKCLDIIMDDNGRLAAEKGILAEGLPEIPMSWVHIPFAEKMRFSEGGMARMIRPEQLPFNASAVPTLQMKEAIIWHLTYHDNFGHLLGEHGPTLHNTLCTFLGR